MKVIIIGLIALSSISAFSKVITTGQTLTWKSPNGSSSALILTNLSRANTLDLVISGVKNKKIVISYDGETIQSLNGTFSIPPNTPNFKLQAFGDFSGAIINISNITSPENPAKANIQTFPDQQEANQ